MVDSDDHKITKNLFKDFIYIFAPLEPMSANPILRELMGLNGAQIVYRPKILPQHLLKAKKWQKLEKIKDISNIKTYDKKKIFDGAQIIARPGDPIRPAVRYLDENAKRLGISFIDLNFSCPGYKVLPEKRGGELLKFPKLIMKVIDQTLGSSHLPVSIKIRRGYLENDTPTALCKEIYRKFGSNIKWISINRAPVKMKGVSIQNIINDITPYQQCTDAVENTIPIIANGGITSVEQVLEIQDITKISGIMIGRAALGHQSIFKELSSLNNIEFKDQKHKNNYQILERDLEELFKVIHKYQQGPQGRWTNIGSLKKLLFYYIKHYYLSQHKSLPQNLGFSKWNNSHFSPTEIKTMLNKILPMIAPNKWDIWLSYLR
ncbi:MAG: tRNA-dihydrouridine synthase [Promethearchaeota archaeon]